MGDPLLTGPVVTAKAATLWRALAIAGALCAGVGPSGAAAQRVVVICNASVAIDAGDVQAIFLGDKQLAGSTRLVPVDNTAAQGEFLVLFVNLDAAKYRSRWIRKAFRDGLTAPAARATDLAVIDFVRSTPGAIGYVTTEPPKDVTIVAERK